MKDLEIERPQLWLWFALLTPSMVWMTYLFASFMVAGHFCKAPSSLLHTLAIVSFILSSFAFWAGLKSFKHYKVSGPKPGPNSGQLLASISLFLAILIMAIIVTGEYTTTILEPCL